MQLLQKRVYSNDYFLHTPINESNHEQAVTLINNVNEL